MLRDGQEPNGQIPLDSFIASSRTHHSLVICRKHSSSHRRLLNKHLHSLDTITLRTYNTWRSHLTINSSSEYRIGWQHFRSLPFREYLHGRWQLRRPRKFLFGIASLPSAFEHSPPRAVFHTITVFDLQTWTRRHLLSICKHNLHAPARRFCFFLSMSD